MIKQPPGVVSIRIDPNPGRRATANDDTAMFEYFLEPFLPEQALAVDHSILSIDKNDENENNNQHNEYDDQHHNYNYNDRDNNYQEDESSLY